MKASDIDTALCGEASWAGLPPVEQQRVRLIASWLITEAGHELDALKLTKEQRTPERKAEALFWVAVEAGWFTPAFYQRFKAAMEANEIAFVDRLRKAMLKRRDHPKQPPIPTDAFILMSLNWSEAAPELKTIIGSLLRKRGIKSSVTGLGMKELRDKDRSAALVSYLGRQHALSKKLSGKRGPKRIAKTRERYPEYFPVG